MGTGKVGRAEVQINLSTYNPINYCYTEVRKEDAEVRRALRNLA
jgi:hypothetical protein